MPKTGTTEDILCWYVILQGKIEKKSCEDTEANFGRVKLPLGGQG